MTACLWTFGVVELPEVEAHSLYILTIYPPISSFIYYSLLVLSVHIYKCYLKELCVYRDVVLSSFLLLDTYIHAHATRYHSEIPDSIGL